MTSDIWVPMYDIYMTLDIGLGLGQGVRARARARARARDIHYIYRTSNIYIYPTSDINIGHIGVIFSLSYDYF